MPLPRSGVSPTSLARVPGRSRKSPGGEFRVSPRNLLCGVSLPGGGTGGVGVDERVEGASRRPPWFGDGAMRLCPTLIDLDMQDRGCGLPRIPLPRTRVHRDLLAYLLVLRSRWVQPQGDV